MEDNFVKLKFDHVLRVEKIITVFYMEFSKDFQYDGERHDFWEMVYIDNGEMVCTADTNQFTLKSGELTFHKPNEFHNLSGNRDVAPNVSILTFECKSRAMQQLAGKIFRLNGEEKNLISMLFEEALSCYRLEDENDPLLQKLIRLEDAPFGASQMTKNLLEIFLIKLQRNKETVTKQSRFQGLAVPYEVEEIIDYLHQNLYGRVTIADVAAALGKSPSTVKKQFSLHMPTGIIDYYNSLKIKEAKKLIREGKYNFTQIADLLGFDTPQYFSKCFKDRTHRTPGEYKRSIIK
ncbi:MAG: helix-turn-helix transcriptional regulator [Clostridia bacterium]|nr:helix-turn-helix transcriptional regulator [Clostridia bacterium]